MFDLLGAWVLVSLAERPAEVPEDQQAVWEDHGRHTPSPAEAGECSALRPPRQGTYLNVSYLVSVADPWHFCADPDPDPANQNFRNGSGSRIRILLINKTHIFPVPHIFLLVL